MSDRPIIFSGPMVRALLDGRKTQTRRKLQIRRRRGFFQFGRSDLPDYDWTFRRADHVWEDWKHDQLLSKLPYVIGDRLWVREAWRVGAWHYHNAEVAIDYCDGPSKEWLGVDDPDMLHRLIDQSRAEAKKAGSPLRDSYYEYSWSPGDSPCRWRPSIHMPRWASRLTLIVTDVRVQRLHDIKYEDIGAEGIEATDIWKRRQADCVDRNIGCGMVRRDSFADLWNSIHGPDAWDANPWVAAYTFTVHKRNIDEVQP